MEWPSGMQPSLVIEQEKTPDGTFALITEGSIEDLERRDELTSAITSSLSMPPRACPVPRGSFASHSKHLQQRLHHPSCRRLASSNAATLWRGQDPITRLGQSITGGMEWQTSMYSFNKQNSKTLPVAATNVEKMIQAYVTMKKTDTRVRDPRAIRTALSARRRSANRVYVSKPRIKDFGDRIELTAYVYCPTNIDESTPSGRSSNRSRSSPSSSSSTHNADLILKPEQQAGLQSLISRMYGKPVALSLIPLSKPHLDADILAALVTQQLRDRKMTPRRVIRDATWKSPLPSAQKVVEILQRKRQQRRSTMAWTDFTVQAAARTSASSIVQGLALSQVSSVQVEAAGRLTKRLTANRSVRKMARRGATSKIPGFMLRGFRKAHVQYASSAGKRRVGQYGIRVSLGHS